MKSLEYIHALAKEGREDPYVRRKAFQIMRQAGVTDGRQSRQVIQAIFNWIQRNVFYMHDPTGVELLTSPSLLIWQAEHNEATEDCDSFVALAHALYNSVGLATQSVIWKADKRAPNQWSHITLEVNDGKGWLPVDPIMKNKPLGWSPPKYYAKRVVPVGDGQPWPKHMSNTPVKRLPSAPANKGQQTMGSFFAGASNAITWGGFGRYGADTAPDLSRASEYLRDEAQLAPPSSMCEHPASTVVPAENSYELWAKDYASKVITAAGARPQGKDAMTWIYHIRSILSQGLDRRGWIPPLQHPGQSQDYQWGYQLLRGLARYSKTYWPEMSAKLDEGADFLDACVLNRQAWLVENGPRIAKARAIGTLQQQVKEMRRIRNEAMTYVPALMAGVEPLMLRAEAMMGRIENKAEQMELVNEIVKWAGLVLSALGPVTGGITELINIVIQIGNLAYQMRAAAKLMSGSAAKTLNEIASALDGIQLNIEAALAVAQAADAEMAQRYTMLELVYEQDPEFFEAATQQHEAEAQAAATRGSIAVPLMLTAAGVGLLALVF